MEMLRFNNVITGLWNLVLGEDFGLFDREMRTGMRASRLGDSGLLPMISPCKSDGMGCFSFCETFAKVRPRRPVVSTGSGLALLQKKLEEEGEIECHTDSISQRTEV